MKKYLILAAAAATFTACSFDRDLEFEDDGPNIIMVGATTGDVTVSTSTRSSTTTLQDAQAASMTENTAGMGLYILKDNYLFTQTDAANYQHFNTKSTSLTVNNPAANYTKIGTPTYYYPDQKGQGIDVYVYSPYSGSAPTCADNTHGIDQTFAISTSTAQTYDADYYANDFLWGAVGEHVTTTNGGAAYPINATNYKLAKGGTATSGFVTGTGEIIVPMVHLGSKIIIKVVAGLGMSIDKLKGATVDFNVDYLNGTLKISDGTVATSGSATSSYINMGKLGYSAASTAIAAGNATGSNGVLWNSATDDADDSGTMDDTEVKAYLCSGVILPQTVRIDDGAPTPTPVPLIKITLSDTQTVYAYTPVSVPTFAKKTKYTFTITVNATALAVTTTVNDWADGTSSLPDPDGSGGSDYSPGDGNAELQ